MKSRMSNMVQSKAGKPLIYRLESAFRSVDTRNVFIAAIGIIMWLVITDIYTSGLGFRNSGELLFTVAFSAYICVDYYGEYELHLDPKTRLLTGWIKIFGKKVF